MSETTEPLTEVPDDLPEIIEERPAAVTQEDLAELLEKEKQRATAAEDREKREREGRERAERERDEAHGTAHTARDGQIRAEELAVDQAMTNARAEADRVEGEVTRLQSEGKFADATKLMRQFSRVEVTLAQLEARKQYLEQEKARPAPAPKQTGVDLSGYSPAARTWINQNPEFLTDPDFQQAVTTAHHMALRAKVKPDTPEYFDYIESQVHGEPEETPAPAPRRAPAPALAVARRAPVPAASARAPMRMDPEQVEIALAMGEVLNLNREDSIKRYWLETQKAKREGKI